MAYPSEEQPLHLPQSPQLHFWEPRSPPVGLSAEVDGFDQALSRGASIHRGRKSFPWLLSGLQGAPSPSEPLCHFLLAPSHVPPTLPILSYLLYGISEAENHCWRGRIHEFMCSCIEKNNDHKLLFWRDWDKSVPCPLPSLSTSAPTAHVPQLRARGSGCGVRLVLSCGDCLGLLLEGRA